MTHRCTSFPLVYHIQALHQICRVLIRIPHDLYALVGIVCLDIFP